MQRKQAFALTCLLVGLTSCASGTAKQFAVQAGDDGAPLPRPAPQLLPSAGLSLPAPAVLAEHLAPPRAASYVPEDLYKEADVFEPGMPLGRVTAASGNALFEPDYTPASPNSDGLAFASYGFQLAGYGGDATVHLSWMQPPLAGEVWLGLADFAGNRWVWFVPQSPAELSLPSLEPYLLNANDLLVCVLRTGTASSELDWLRIGSLPPKRNLTAEPLVGLVPFTVSFDASGSLDEDGEIAEYRWDPEGDGSFDESSGSDPHFSHEYAAAGDFAAAVRIIDNNGVYADTAVAINAVEEMTFTYGSDPGDEDIRSVIALADGSLLLFGRWDDLSSADDQVFAARVSSAGTAQFTKLWGSEKSEMAFDAVLAADGYIYACGQTTSAGPSDQDALVQKWSQDGELVFSQAVGGSAGFERFAGLLVVGEDIYACGNYRDPVLNRTYGLICKLNAQGDPLWAYTLISPKNCYLEDIALYFPITPDPPSLRVCGTYDTSETDQDCVYAEYDLDGNRLDCQLWGIDGRNESGQSINVSGALQLRTYVLGTKYYDQHGVAFLGSPGGTTIELQDPQSLTADGLRFPTALLTRSTGSGYGLALVTVSSSFELLGQTEFNAIPDGSTIPRCLARLPGGGLAIAGMQWGELPTESALDLELSNPGVAWESISPPQDAPTISGQKLPVDTIDVSDMEFNRGADKWDAYVLMIK